VKVDRNKENISILSGRVGNMMAEKYIQVYFMLDVGKILYKENNNDV
jgi:hypothetical protein